MTREEAIDVYNGLINTKIKEAFEFFAPELRKPEDERMLKKIISYLEMIKMGGVICTIDTSEEIAWLKSLRPDSYKKCNSRWKPTEEQMKAFKNSVEHIPNAYYDDMWELYEQLKKL